jgi:hypothetical protein
MPAGCCARAPAGRVGALVMGFEVAADAHGFELAWRVPFTPVRSMLTAL